MTELKKVIITGPTGSVGISLIEELIEKGIEITAICREHSDGIENIPKNHLIQVVECNLEKFGVSFWKIIM